MRRPRVICSAYVSSDGRYCSLAHKASFCNSTFWSIVFDSFADSFLCVCSGHQYSLAICGFFAMARPGTQAAPITIEKENRKKVADYGHYPVDRTSSPTGGWPAELGFSQIRLCSVGNRRRSVADRGCSALDRSALKGSQTCAFRLEQLRHGVSLLKFT